jgi:hypothetical protein
VLDTPRGEPEALQGFGFSDLIGTARDAVRSFMRFG